MSFIGETAKKIIPAKQWNCLRDIKKWKFSKFARRSGRKIGWPEFFWSGAKTFIKDNIVVCGRLDYFKKDIKMSVENCAQLTRLNACGKEPETVRWIEENMKPGEIFYDIGAHVGAYSFVAWAAAGGNCRIFAFEPDPVAFLALNRNIVLNNCGENFKAFPIGLSNRQKYSPLLGFSLDDFVEKFSLPLPNHVKIDVDGPEREVAEGARKVLSNPDLRTILIEIDENNSQNRQIPAIMESLGFRLDSKHQRGRETLANCIFKKK